MFSALCNPMRCGLKTGDEGVHCPSSREDDSVFAVLQDEASATHDFNDLPHLLSSESKGYFEAKNENDSDFESETSPLRCTRNLDLLETCRRLDHLYLQHKHGSETNLSDVAHGEAFNPCNEVYEGVIWESVAAKDAGSSLGLGKDRKDDPVGAEKILNESKESEVNCYLQQVCDDHKMGQRTSTFANKALSTHSSPGSIINNAGANKSSRGSKISLTWALRGEGRQPIKDILWPTSQQANANNNTSNNKNNVKVNNVIQKSLGFKPPIKAMSQPSLVGCGKSESGQYRECRRRSRNNRNNKNDKNKVGHFGYDIHDVDLFLSKASLQKPANIPVVLASQCTLYQTSHHNGGKSPEEFVLPLGMVVNAVFKNQGWLYVQTPHGEEGYVNYRTCIPLGILPENRDKNSTLCPWETHTDIFPEPLSGRKTAAVCDVRIPENRGRRSRSEDGRCAKKWTIDSYLNKTDNEKLNENLSQWDFHRSKNMKYHQDSVSECNRRWRGHTTSRDARSACSEQIRPRHNHNSHRIRSISANRLNDDNVLVNGTCVTSQAVREARRRDLSDHMRSRCHREMSVDKLYMRAEAEKSLPHKHCNTNSEHLIVRPSPSRADEKHSANVGHVSSSNHKLMKETLLVIQSDYQSKGRNTVSVSKNDVVVLLNSNLKDWFWIRKPDGTEGFIPSVVAGHGFF